MPRELWRDLHTFPCLHTAATATRPSSERDPSVHHIPTPALIVDSFPIAQSCGALLAAAVSSSMVVLTAGSWPGAGQYMPLVVTPCSCSFLTTLHIGAPEEGLLGSFVTLLLHVYSSLAANCCCLESKIASLGVSPDSRISAPHGVGGSTPRMDLACRLRRSWRSSRLPTSVGSHQSVLPYSAIAWKHAIWTPLKLS